MMLRSIALLGALGTLFVVGCSETNRPVFQQTYAVRGKVLSPSGSVINGGRIQLHPDKPENPEARGMIEKGTFVLGTYKIDDGVVPGTYTATVEPMVYDKAGNLRPDKSLAIPKKYADPKTSGLKVEIKGHPNEEVVLKLK